jgi:hypothetical protein
MGPALWILAIGPNITVIHRIVHTWKQAEATGNVLPNHSSQPSGSAARTNAAQRPAAGTQPVQSKAARASHFMLRSGRGPSGRER